MSTNRGQRINFGISRDDICPEREDPNDPPFVTKIIGVTEFFSAYGTYNMSGMILESCPGYDIPVKLIIESIDI